MEDRQSLLDYSCDIKTVDASSIHRTRGNPGSPPREQMEATAAPDPYIANFVLIPGAQQLGSHADSRLPDWPGMVLLADSARNKIAKGIDLPVNIDHRKTQVVGKVVDVFADPVQRRLLGTVRFDATVEGHAAAELVRLNIANAISVEMEHVRSAEDPDYALRLPVLGSLVFTFNGAAITALPMIGGAESISYHLNTKPFENKGTLHSSSTQLDPMDTPASTIAASAAAVATPAPPAKMAQETAADLAAVAARKHALDPGNPGSAAKEVVVTSTADHEAFVQRQNELLKTAASTEEMMKTLLARLEAEQTRAKQLEEENDAMKQAKITEETDVLIQQVMASLTATETFTDKAYASLVEVLGEQERAVLAAARANDQAGMRAFPKAVLQTVCASARAGEMIARSVEQKARETAERELQAAQQRATEAAAAAAAEKAAATAAEAERQRTYLSQYQTTATDLASAKQRMDALQDAAAQMLKSVPRTTGALPVPATKAAAAPAQPHVTAPATPAAGAAAAAADAAPETEAMATEEAAFDASSSSRPFGLPATAEPWESPYPSEAFALRGLYAPPSLTLRPDQMGLLDQIDAFYKGQGGRPLAQLVHASAVSVMHNRHDGRFSMPGPGLGAAS